MFRVYNADVNVCWKLKSGSKMSLIFTIEENILPKLTLMWWYPCIKKNNRISGLKAKQSGLKREVR